MDYKGQFEAWSGREAQAEDYSLGERFDMAADVYAEVDYEMRGLKVPPQFEVPRVTQLVRVRRNTGLNMVRFALHGHAVPLSSDERIVALETRWDDAEIHLTESLELAKEHLVDDRPPLELQPQQRRRLWTERGETEGCLARRLGAFIMVKPNIPLDEDHAGEVVDQFKVADQSLQKGDSAEAAAENAVRTALAYWAFGGRPERVEEWQARARDYAAGRLGIEGLEGRARAQFARLMRSVGSLSVKQAQERMLNWRTV
jgi:hypothetical protein